MKQQFFSDMELERAAESVGKALLGSLPPPAPCGHAFSPGFLTRMEALLRREKLRRGPRRARATAAIAAVALLAGLSLWAGSTGYAGGSFAAWSKEAVLGGLLDSFSGAAAEQAVPSYQLSWLPEGCQETERYVRHSVVSILYQSGGADGQEQLHQSDLTGEDAAPSSPDPWGGLELVFTYRRLPTASAFTLPFDTADYTCKTVEVKGIQAELYLPLDAEASAALIWADEEAGILFSLYGNLTEAELLQAAQSVCLIE